MKVNRAFLHCLGAGLFVTLLQIVVALWLATPDWSLRDRYWSLIQHDSYWFANIVDRGYGTSVPPIDHKVMEVSNVAFFPAYPLFAALMQRAFHLHTFTALLLVAQLAAWGFWTYFFLFAERWHLSRGLRFGGAVVIAAHPAAFYLVAGYSESLFLMMLAGFIYWSGIEGRTAKILAALHGFGMSATRIVGIPCAAYPLVRAVFRKGRRGLRRPRRWLQQYGSALALSAVAMLGAVFFFVYCQLRWGRWDIYMLTQEAGWAIQPDYLAAFRLANYRWALPPLNDTLLVSQFTTSLAAAFFGFLVLGELLPAFRRGTGWTQRIGLYFCAATIFYISLAGVASVQMQSMLRYDLCVHALIVLAVLHYLHQFRLPPLSLRALGAAVVALASAAGLGVEGWYVWNFMRGNWIA